MEQLDQLKAERSYHLRWIRELQGKARELESKLANLALQDREAKVDISLESPEVLEQAIEDIQDFRVKYTASQRFTFDGDAALCRVCDQLKSALARRRNVSPK